MIKRTLFFQNPCYLNTRDKQLVVNFPEELKKKATVPIEDLGYVVLENPQITVSVGLLRSLAENNVGVLTCNAQHLPSAFLQPLIGHSEQTERMRVQIAASLPLKKQLWQQTVQAKIENQANHLMFRGKNGVKLKRWAKQVLSGDSGNHEAIAAAYYFGNILEDPHFRRFPSGRPPNNLLNYGYAILRAVTARALVSSGMFPSFGIFHRNKYNPFCLADDIMEPYRPYVDLVVFEIVESGCQIEDLNTSLKAELLKIPAMDVIIDGKKSPLMNAMSRTTNSLWECFNKERRQLLYPVFSIE